MKIISYVSEYWHNVELQIPRHDLHEHKALGTDNT